MPLHEKAVFQNDENVWETITPIELLDAENLAIFRTKKLYDSSDCNYELFIRNREDAPHFYRKGIVRHNLDKYKESEEHDKKVISLLSFLNNNKKVKLKTYFFKNFEDRELYEITTMRNYEWDKEVTFAISEKGFVRFDILGRPISLNCTNTNPFVAIEVVDTHFSSKASFNALLALSKKLPFVIGYFFVKNTPRYNCPNNTKGNSMAYMRVSCYIHDGDFWILDDRISDTVSEEVRQNPDAYYEYVYEKVKKIYL